MGEHADDAYDRAMDEEYGNRWDIDDRYGFTRYEPRILTCRHCRKTGLTWGMSAGGWRLFAGSAPHVCSTTTPDDFDALE